MLIQPDTYIRLIKNCPLDKTYDHTLYFNSETEQITYFKNTLQGIPFNKQSYQRCGKDVLHIQEKAENLYDCNYLMFQNTAFGNKYFYAFITSIEYVNNVSSKVYYVIDVMQTWFFDYTLQHCFVEREHSETDNIGENLIPENVNLGEYVSEYASQFSELVECSIVIASTHAVEDGKINLKSGRIYSLIYSGLFYNVFPATDDGVEQANAFISLDSLLPGGSGIVSIFMMPTSLISNSTFPKAFDKIITKHYGSWGEFTPNNNKLYTYPYNFLYVSNLQGNSATYKYEFFDSENCVFYLIGDTSCNPGVILIPTNYKGVTTNYDESITLSGFPQCAYTNDAFAANLSQLSSGGNISTLSASVASLAVGNPSGVLPVVSSLVDVGRSLITPNQARGGSNNYTLFASGCLNFYYANKRITREFAEIIDGYFDMYGYATRKVKIPNINSRPHWNYVQTNKCVITGSIPADTAVQICSIYDRGITFWKNGSEVGNYSLDNRPA